MENKERLETLDGAKLFFDELSEDCKINLMAIMKEEMEKIKKYRIMINENLRCDYESAKKAGYNQLSITRSYKELTVGYIEKLLKSGIINNNELNENLIYKIKNGSFNLEEAKKIVNILSNIDRKFRNEKRGAAMWGSKSDILVEGELCDYYEYEPMPNQ